MRPAYPPLAPSHESETSAANKHVTSGGLKRKRTNTRVACNACRLKKSACDAKRPVCSACSRRETECSYLSAHADDTPTQALKRQIQYLEQKLKGQTELLDHLKSVPEKDAIELLRGLNSPSDGLVVLASAKSSSLIIRRPSEHQVARGVLPTIRSDLEFELMLRHPMVYPTLIPVDIASIGLSTLFGPSRRQSSLHEDALLSSKNPVGKLKTSSLPRLDAASETAELLPRPMVEATSSSQPGEEDTKIFPSPCAPAPCFYCDDRLRQLRIGYWTSVPISDESAASVISLYLTLDHPLHGFFDADLFLTDLVDHRLRFCSPILVSALLHLACQSYTAVDVRASALGHAFFIEAELLWTAERSHDSLTTAAAAQIFSYGCATRGKDELSRELEREGRRMAERLLLFGVPKSESAANYYSEMSPDWKKATAHTAWGIHNWLTLRGFYYQDEAIMYPPLAPIPGTYREDGITKSGVQWPSHPLPLYMGKTFTALCEFWTVVQKVAAVYFARNGTSLIQRVSLAFAESKYQKLLDWADALRAEMARNELSPEHVILFHIIFHSAIIHIFQPFLHNPRADNLNSFASQDSSPQAVYAASLNQLKRLVLLCLLEYPRTMYSMMLNAGLLAILSALISNESDAPEWWFYFMLCMRIYKELYVCFPIYKDITQGFLAMGLRNGVISSSEARELMEDLMKAGQHHKTVDQVTGSFTIDFDLALTDPDEAKAHNLAMKFDELALFDEVTSGDYVTLEPEETKKGKRGH